MDSFTEKKITHNLYPISIICVAKTELPKTNLSIEYVEGLNHDAAQILNGIS